MDGLLGSDRDPQRSRVRHPDVFRGEDDEAASDEQRILSSIDHTGEIVESGVGVGTSQRLDERRNRVVMSIGRFIVDWRAPLCRVLDSLGGYLADAVLVGQSRLRCQLQRVQRDARIPIREQNDGLHRFFIELGAESCDAKSIVAHRTEHDLLDLAFGEHPQHEDPRP